VIPISSYKTSRKPVRLNIPGHAHELTFSCYRRKPLLRSRIACLFLAESINAASILHAFHVWAWVFMPEHIHIMLYPTRAEYSISDILKSIKQSSARKVVNYCAENRPDALRHLETGLARPKYRFWQNGGGYDRNYFDDRSILKQIEYIHNNPVRRGLVRSAVEWEWSSARSWIQGGDSAVVIRPEHLDLK
jgi:putative transposase